MNTEAEIIAWLEKLVHLKSRFVQYQTATWGGLVGGTTMVGSAMAYAAERNVNHISALVMASGLVVLVGAYRAYTASITADGTINSMLVRTTWSTPAGRTGKVSAVDVLGNRLELEFDDGRKDRFDIIALRPVAI